MGSSTWASNLSFSLPRVYIMQLARFGIAILLFICRTMSLELTSENWVSETWGKQVFVKFFSPFCGHCKKMKPAWNQLMDSFKDSDSVVIAEVDCSADGQQLCQEQRIYGVPTMKFGDALALQQYRGERSFEALPQRPSNQRSCGANARKEVMMKMTIIRSQNWLISDDSFLFRFCPGQAVAFTFE